MNHSTSGRLQALLAALLLTVGVSLPAAAGVVVHSLTGNARTNIGSLPIPINFTAPPNGNILAVAGATIGAFGPHAASNPAPVTLRRGQLTFAGSGVFPIPASLNGALFQVGTALAIQFPAFTAHFKAGGRTGAPTVAWCPGQTVPNTPAGNPNCATASAGAIPGRMTYTATGHQFGGPASGAVQGTADVALGNAALAPCVYPAVPACTARFVAANPAPIAVNGAAFNASNAVSSPSVNPGKFGINVGTNGTIFSLVSSLGPAGLANNGVSYGGPNTTGMLKIEQPAANGGPETFVINGSDGRNTSVGSLNGQGSLSLVSGAIATRAITGKNANRGWLNLVIGAPVAGVPVMPIYGVALLAGLTALSGAYALRKNR